MCLEKKASRNLSEATATRDACREGQWLADHLESDLHESSTWFFTAERPGELGIVVGSFVPSWHDDDRRIDDVNLSKTWAGTSFETIQLTLTNAFELSR